MRTVLKWTSIAFGLLIVGIIVLVLAFDWNWLKGYAARQASEALGRTVMIEGDLNVKLSWSPLVRIDRLRVANAAWSPEPSLLTVQRLTFHLDLRELLRGHLVLSTVELVEPVLRLEMSEQGQPNWALAPAHPAGNAPTRLPGIHQVHLRDGHVIFVDYSSHTEIAATLTDLRATIVPPEQRLQVAGVGQLDAMPLQFTLYSGTLQELSANRPSPMQVQLIIQPWQVDLHGTIAQPLQLQGVTAEVSVTRLAPDQSADHHGQAAPHQAPYRLAGQLTQEGDVWAVRGLTGTLGTSDLAGEVFLEIQDKRPLVRATLVSRHLDVRDLQTWRGAAGAPPPAVAAQPPGEDAPSAAAIDLKLTRAVNVALHFEGQTVTMANQTLRNVSTDLALHDGHLTLTPVFRLAGGTTRARIEIEDRAEAPLYIAVRADMAQVNVQEVLAALGMEPKVAGSVDGRIDMATSGRSLPQFVSSLAGKAELTVRDHARHTDVQVHVAPESGTTATPPRLRLTSQGRVRGEPFHLEGRVGGWGSGQQPSTVQVQLRLGETRARFDGTLTQGPQHTALAAQIAVQGPDPARLSAFLPIVIPSLPAYRFEGRLLHNDNTWTLKELQGTIGDSDLAGELALDTGGEGLVLHGDLHAQIFVVDELTGYAPEKKPGRVEPEKVRVPEQVPEKVQERPQAIEVTLRFRGDKVIVAKIPLEHLATDLWLHDGRLTLTPTFDLAGGTVRAEVQVDLQTNPLHSTVHTTVQQMNLQQFLSWVELRPEDVAGPQTVGTPEATTKPEAAAKPETTGKPEVAKKPEVAGKLGVAGKLDGQIALTGTGLSLADFLASANGDVLLSMQEGQLGTVLVELVGLNVAEAIEKAIAPKKASQIHCLVADFAVHNGRMETQMLLVDTPDAKVIGGGFIDLHDRVLGLKLEPQDKHFRVLTATSPLYITGPLAKPAAGPKLGEALLSLSIPIKPGKPEDADCQGVLAAAQRRYQSSKP